MNFYFNIISDPSGQYLKLALIAYTFTEGREHEILVRPHGNANSSTPYQRTMHSTLTSLKASKQDKPARASNF